MTPEQAQVLCGLAGIAVGAVVAPYMVGAFFYWLDRRLG